jgi:hypothetical protein
MDPTERPNLLYDLGAITGLLLRYSPEQLEAAARDPQLTATNACMLAILAQCRREIHDRVGV